MEAQSAGLPHSETLQLNGIPDSLSVNKSYRSQTEVFYLIPDSVTIQNFDDLDKTFMQPSNKDERIVMGENSFDSSIYIRQVLNILQPIMVQADKRCYRILWILPPLVVKEKEVVPVSIQVSSPSEMVN